MICSEFKFILKSSVLGLQSKGTFGDLRAHSDDNLSKNSNVNRLLQYSFTVPSC